MKYFNIVKRANYVTINLAFHYIRNALLMPPN